MPSPSPKKSPKKRHRQSWAHAAPPKTTWSSALSDHIRKALSMADEASALIPAVRADISYVNSDGEEMGDAFRLTGHLISRNGVFITDFHQVKQNAMASFHLEEKDDEDATVTIQLLCPDPKEANKYLEMFGQSDMEKSVSVFQAALKFRRPQITRRTIKNNTAIMSKYDPKDGATYAEMELALHRIWELAMLSTNHKRLFASKIPVLDLIVEALRSIATLNHVNSVHVQAAAVLWALAFRQDGRHRLFKIKTFNVVDVLMNALVSVHNIKYKNKTMEQDAMPVTTSFCAFAVGALLSCTHHGQGLKHTVLRLDDLRSLAFDVTEGLTLLLDQEDIPLHTTDWMSTSGGGSSGETDVEFSHVEPITPVWPVSRTSLQDLILFLVGNCVVRKHAQINLKNIWSERSKEIRETDEEEKIRNEKEKKRKSSEKKKERLSSPNQGAGAIATNVALLESVEVNGLPPKWYLSDIPKMLVRNSSVRTRLITISILSEFARDPVGRQVFVNDNRLVGQICDMSEWAMEWLAKVTTEDVDVNSDECLREPILEEDETIELVYQILEHCALSLWGWAMCAVETMLGNTRTAGETDEDSIERQMKAMSAMTSMANTMSQPGSKNNSRPGTTNGSRRGGNGGVMADLSGLAKKKTGPSVMEKAMLRVPGILTTMAGMSNGLIRAVLRPTPEGQDNSSSSSNNNEVHVDTKRNSKNEKKSSSSNVSRSPSRKEVLGVGGDEVDNEMFNIEHRMQYYQVSDPHPSTLMEEIVPYKFLHHHLYLDRVGRIESLGAGCISTIATVKQMAGAILRNGIVAILLKLLFSPGADAQECRECAASALCLFAQGSMEGRREIFTRGGVNVLLNVIAPEPLPAVNDDDNPTSETSKKQNENVSSSDDVHSYAHHRASPKLLGFCTEILHREAYLLDDVVLEVDVVIQLVRSLESVKAPVALQRRSTTTSANEDNDDMGTDMYMEDVWMPTTEQDPDEDWILQTHIACTVWRVGIHPDNAVTLGQVGACAALANVIQPLIITNVEHTYDMMDTKQLEQRRVSLLDFCVLSLWILSYDSSNCARMEVDGVIDILVSVLSIVPHENTFVGVIDEDEEIAANVLGQEDQRSNTAALLGVSYSGLHESALKCLWVIASSSVQLARRCVSSNVMSVLRRLPIGKMGWGASVLQVLMSADTSSRQIIAQEYGEDVLEQMLVYLMRSNVPYLMSYGCLGAARCAMSSGGRYRLVGVEGCLATILQVLSTTRDGCTQVHAGRALLNLSKSSSIQIEICKQGLYTLIEVSWSPRCEEARLVINGVLQNIGNNPKNRDLLYRAELHIKASVENNVKSTQLLNMLSSLPHHMQSSLRSVASATDPNKQQEQQDHRPGQRLSPLVTLGPKEHRARQTAQKRRSQYETWINTSHLANEKSIIDDLLTGIVRKPAPKYLPTLSTLSIDSQSASGQHHGHHSSMNSIQTINTMNTINTTVQSTIVKPTFTMKAAMKSNAASTTSLSSLPVYQKRKHHHHSHFNSQQPQYDPSSSTASALPTMASNNMNNASCLLSPPPQERNENTMLLDESEIPSGLEIRLLEHSLLNVSGVPMLGQSLRSPMSNMYTTVPPNSSLQKHKLQPVRREWGGGNQNNGIVSMSMNSMTNSIDSTTILIPSFTQLPLEVAELGDDEMSSFIEHSFWQRGPMNVTSLKISSGNKVQPTLTVQVSHKRILAAQKRQVMQQLNSTQKVSPTKKNKKEKQKEIQKEMRQHTFQWRLQSPAYYWRSMLQETNSFGVQMTCTHQVLLNPDQLPMPPLQLPPGTKDELPPPPETPGLPEDEPRPLQVPPLGPPVPQKHTLPVDEHTCKCHQNWSFAKAGTDQSDNKSQKNDQQERGWQVCTILNPLKQHSERCRYSAYEGGDCGMFGRLRDRHMQYRLQKTVFEKVKEVAIEEKKKWFIFEERLEHSDARDYYDVEIYPKMCTSDFNRVAEQEHFVTFLSKKLGGDMTSEAMLIMLEELHQCFQPYYQHIMYSFEFYSAMGNSSDMSQMLYNQCMDFLGDTELVEPKNKKMDRSVMDSIFIEANKEGEEQQESEVGDTNADRALMRFELVEMLIRIALKKFYLPGTCGTLPEAVKKVLEDHVMPNDASGSCSAAIHDIDAFREECLYCDEVDTLLRTHNRTLRAIFEKFQDEENVRLKNDQMSYKYYMRFLKQVKFVNEDFTLRECRLTYVWSRMKVIDEVGSHDTWGYITYVDWLEALARMAQLKCVPSPSDLEEMQSLNILKSKETHTYGLLRAWHKMSVGNNQGKLLDRASGEWGAPSERPWVEKFQALIDLLFCVFDEDGDGVDLEDLQYWKPKP